MTGNASGETVNAAGLHASSHHAGHTLQPDATRVTESRSAPRVQPHSANIRTPPSERPEMQHAKTARRTTRRTINAETAATAVGAISHGIDVTGLSKGQFSLIELIEHCLATTGPADLTISTWTAAGADLAHAQQLLISGNIRTCRWLVDFSFPSRQPVYCAQLRDRFGDDAIRVTANHAKFVLICNDDWNICIRTSMNLNLNKRLESYEISDDADMAAWFGEIIAETFAEGGAATIETALNSPSSARSTLHSLAGTVERADPAMSFNAGSRVSYD